MDIFSTFIRIDQNDGFANMNMEMECTRRPIKDPQELN